MKRKIASVFGAFLIVAMAINAPFMANTNVSPVGTASATHNCGTTDALVAAITFTYVNYDKCTNNHVGHVIEDMKNSDDNQTKVDIYNGGTSQKSQYSQNLDTKDNYLVDSETVAWNKAQVAAFAAIENGTSESVAQSRARQAISDYYARMQMNLIASWNTTVSNYEYLETQENTEGISDSFVNYNSQSNDYGGPLQYSGTEVRTVTLTNGTTVNVLALHFENSDTPNDASSYWKPSNGNANMGSYAEPTALTINAPNSNYEELLYLPTYTYSSTWGNITSTQSRLNDNVDAYVSEIYTEAEAGNIDPTEYIEPGTMVQEYSQQYNETGYWAYSVASLSAMGLETPDLNGTGQMTVDYQGNTYNGLIMSQQAPTYGPNSTKTNGTWYSGYEYHTSNIDGSQLLVTTDGEQLEMEGNFTITEMTDKDGETIDTTTTQEYNYKTTNTTEYNQLQEELSLLRQEIESREPTAGGGSTTTNNGIPSWLTAKYGPIPLWGWIGMVLAGAYVMQSARGS